MINPSYCSIPANSTTTLDALECELDAPRLISCRDIFETKAKLQRKNEAFEVAITAYNDEGEIVPPRYINHDFCRQGLPKNKNILP